MADTFKNIADKTGPADRWYLIVPPEAPATETVLPIVPRAIFCAETGDITMEDAAGTSLDLTGVAAHAILPLRPVIVTAATGVFYAIY